MLENNLPVLFQNFALFVQINLLNDLQINMPHALNQYLHLLVHIYHNDTLLKTLLPTSKYFDYPKE